MEVGKPELPVVRSLLGYPIDKSADSVELVSATWEHFYNYLIYPHQPDYLLEGPKPPFQWDQFFYGQNIWYPAETAIIAEPGMLRDVKVINTGVQSFKYNPFYRHLMVASEIIVRVNYGLAGGGKEGRFRQRGDDPSGVHPDTIPYYQSLIWNVSELGLHPTTVETDYLIITGDSYYDELVRLQRLLEFRGYQVERVKMSDISPEGDPLDVYHYIKEQFLNKSYVYVLLVGDVPDTWGTDQFNYNTMVPIPYWLPLGNDDGQEPTTHRPSDVCYSCIDNPDPPTAGGSDEWEQWWLNFDMYPDIFVGRLTADNVTQVNHMIDKLWEYEEPNISKTNNPSSPWYDTMLFVACKFDDEWGLNSLREKKRIKENRYDINLPSNIEILCSDDGNLNANNNYVMKFIENGCNIVNYWGHGSQHRWREWTDIPDLGGYISFYDNPHIRNLNNENLVVVFNMGCSMAAIDNSNRTDDNYGDSLCCGWLKENRGGIAAIGATRRMWLYGTFYEAHDQNLFYVMYGVPEDNIFDWEPRNDISVVHYGAIERTFATNYEQPYNKIQYILPSDYIYILIGEPSMKIRNKYTEEPSLSINKPEKLIKETPMEITIYPNPSSSGIFTLKYKGSPSSLNNVEIYDISGRLVKKIEIPQKEIETVSINDNTLELELQLDLKELKDGIYILSVDKEVYKNILICR